MAQARPMSDGAGPSRRREEPAQRDGVVLLGSLSVRLSTSQWSVSERSERLAQMTHSLITFAAMLAVTVGILLALVGLEMRADKAWRARGKASGRRRAAASWLKALGARSQTHERNRRVRRSHSLSARQ